MTSFLKLKEPISLYGHTGQVWSVTWNPKPKNAQDMLASAGDDKIIVWSCINSKWNMFKNQEDASVHCLDWSLDGLLLCCNENSISIIKETTVGYATVSRLNLPGNTPLSCARWYPSGNHFAVAGYKVITVGDVVQQNENVIAEMTNVNTSFGDPGHDGAINGISFLSDLRMVSAGADKKLKIWFLDSDSKRGLGTDRSLQKRNIWRCSGIFGNLIASACGKRTINFFVRQDNVAGSEAYAVGATKTAAHGASIKDLKWHCQDPYKLASVGLDGLVKVWEVTH